MSPRRALALALAVSVAFSACSKAEERDVSDEVDGAIGPSATLAPLDDGATATTAAAPGGASATTTPGAGGAGGTPADEATRVAAAEDALDAYLDALAAEDFAAAQEASSGSARFMVRVREVVTRFNAQREGTTSLRYATRSFRKGIADATRVAFIGSARLDSTVSGPAGEPRSESSLFENPVVAVDGGAWRVADYTFDGKPIDHHPSTASTKVRDVTLRLAGALGFGEVTGVVIDLGAEKDHSLRVDNVRLALDDGTVLESQLGVLVEHKPSALYFTFARAGAKPVSWSATVTLDRGTTSETTQAVLLRF